jgi:hypothetical protein
VDEDGEPCADSISFLTHGATSASSRASRVAS